MAFLPRKSLKPYEAVTAHELLRRTAQRLPSGVAFIDGDKRFSYSQINQYSDKFASALIAAGVAKGDRVGILTLNCGEFLVAFFGISKAGGVATTINAGYRDREIAHQLSSSQASTLIVHRSLAKLADSVRSELPGLKRVIILEEGSADPHSLWAMIEHAPKAAPNVHIDPLNDLVALPYSSGTTGLTKGVMHTHYSLCTNVRQTVEREGEMAPPRAGDVIFAHTPLFTIAGIKDFMVLPMMVGATVVSIPRSEPALFMQTLAEQKVTSLQTVPAIVLSLINHPDVEKYDLSALRRAVVGAAPVSADLQKKLQDALGKPVIQAYGMTECPLPHIGMAEPEFAKLGSTGPVVSDVEQKIVDWDTGTKEMPSGETGELMVRGALNMKGYFNDPVSTKNTLTEDGWVHTGDIARIDKDGYCWIVDRKKELIKYKAFQVPPAELEGLLLQYPGIVDCAVVAKPDEEAGEIPKAFIVAKKGTHINPDEVMAFISKQVATFKRVREVEFIDSIPRNPAGKILRRVLIEQEREKLKGK